MRNQLKGWLANNTVTDTHITRGLATRGSAFRLKGKNPVIVLLPADLDEGNYELQIVTQYSGGTKMLKTPRTVTRELFVGDASEEPGGGGEIIDPTA